MARYRENLHINSDSTAHDTSRALNRHGWPNETAEDFTS